MTFSSTPANTGYHIKEVILTYVFDNLKIEASKLTDVSLFKWFRDNFDHLEHSKLEPYDSKPVNLQVKSIVNSLKTNAIYTEINAIDSKKT